jgi:hypothetical protein
LLRCPLPGESQRVEYKQFSEPISLNIGSGADDDELVRAIDRIPDAAACEAKLGDRADPDDLVRIPLHAERLLQGEVSKHRTAQGLVGPILVSLLVTVSGIQWLTWNTKRPIILRGWPAVERAFSARKRGEPLRTQEDFDRVLR